MAPAVPNPLPAVPRPSRRLVLAHKLQAPAAQPHQVQRAQALDHLASAPHARLVLLRAPAGFGKSTVMLQLRARLAAQGVDTAWLTLDRADNDVSRFLVALQAAVDALLGGPDDGGPTPAGAGELGADMLQLITRLVAHDRPFALFLDDFEALTEPGVLGLVRELLDKLPRGGQLVIGSRSLPDLRLSRLRARGQLLEADTDRLRFSLDETRGFFETRGPGTVQGPDLLRLHRKTEGWAAALWLAAVALERHAAPAEFIERFSGTNQAVADYLAEEVLARLAPAQRQFLLHTSVLRQLEVPLCNALLPQLDGEAVLREIEQAGVLVVPLGEDGRTFRYHSLFARFLRAQLQREAPERVPGLHAAAADWYEAQQRPVPAIDHAIESGDTLRMLDLLERHGPPLLGEGRLRLLARWFSAIPDAMLASRPRLQVLKLWAVCFVRGPWEAMELLQRGGLEASRQPDIVAHVRALRPLMLAMMDRYEEAWRLEPDCLQHLPAEPAATAAAAATDDAAQWLAFADTAFTNVMATVATVMGEQAQARRLIDRARRGQALSAGAFNQMYSETAEGILDLQDGRLQQASARFRLAVAATQAGRPAAGVGGTRGAPYGHTHGNAWAGVAYALVIYERGDLDQAARLLQVYLPLIRDVGLADPVMIGHVLGSRIAFRHGEVDDAFQQLAELEYLGHKRRLPRLVCSAQIERSRLLLLQGHHQAARDELDRADDPVLWQRVDRLRYMANDLGYMAMWRWRWEIYAGDVATAAEQLEYAVRAARTAQRRRRALKLGVLQAMALHRIGQAQTALPLLQEVLKTCCAEGYMALVLDEGPLLAPPLHELRQLAAGSGAARSDPIFAEYLARLCHEVGPPPEPEAASADAGATLLLEPLTRKEIHVLQLLAEGYSNSAMAEKLFISDSTVRTHLRNINTKLDVHSRMHAVAAARRLGVIR